MYERKYEENLFKGVRRGLFKWIQQFIWLTEEYTL